MQQCEFCSSGKHILDMNMDDEEAIKHMNIRLAAHTNYGYKSYIEHDLQEIMCALNDAFNDAFNEQEILLDMQKAARQYKGSSK